MHGTIGLMHVSLFKEFEKNYVDHIIYLKKS
jgi:hypothetical protein